MFNFHLHYDGGKLSIFYTKFRILVYVTYATNEKEPKICCHVKIPSKNLRKTIKHQLLR